MTRNLRDAYLPTRQEIKKQCEEIREKWSKLERARREKSPEPYEVPQVKICDSNEIL